MSVLQIPTAEVFVPLLASARYKGAWGGRGSGKSHFFADLLVERAVSQPGLRAVCVREIQKSLSQSVKRLVEDKIKLFDVPAFHALKTEIETPGGGIITFQGMQNHTAASIKSLEGFDIAWVEEAQNFSEHSLSLLRPTIRKDAVDGWPAAEMWFSWNPNSEKDPVDKLLRKEPPSAALVVQANYNDNPWFPKSLKEEMEHDLRRDKERYAHVWLGQYRNRSEAQVFRNWRKDILELPANARPYYGADWGFATDPTVLVRCFIFGRTLYVDAEIWKIGCDIDRTPALFDSIGRSDEYDPKLSEGEARKWPLKADSARPETISYMAQHGYPRITGARKGPGSVEEGVEFLKSYDIVVHPRCKRVIDELTLYSYEVDKQTEEVLPVLADKDNHTIDALRYAVEELRRTARLVAPIVVTAPYAPALGDHPGYG